MASQTTIPVVDFDAYRLDKEVKDEEDLHIISKRICDALCTVGFCYLKNHGLPQETIDQVQNISKQFFKLDAETKMRYRSQPGTFTGYRESETDRYNPERTVGDLNEALIVQIGIMKWPEEIPQMEEAYTKLNELGGELALRVLDTISLRFCKTDRQQIRRCHKALLSPRDPQSYLFLRSNFYPELKTKEVKEGQIRFGEHSDYGTVTLLFMDEVGGLEVKTRAGQYIPVHHIPGTVVLNIGDLMQRWTSDELIAAKHRVVIPKGTDMAKERQSLVIFCGPDMDAEIKCLDGSNKYEPITPSAYLEQKLKEVTL